MERQLTSPLYVVAAVAALTAFASLVPMAADAVDVDSIDEGILAEIQSHYGLTEEETIDRLASEMEAAEAARYIEDLSLGSYAGSWFDPESGSLKVAISDPADRTAVERFSASAVIVERSLAELTEMKRGALSAFRNRLIQAGAFRRAYVDYQTNSIVIDVLLGRREQALAAISAAGIDLAAVRVTESAEPIRFSANVRGADGTLNDTWQGDYPEHPSYPFPCSIGASIEEGFITAGHCGEDGNDLETPSESPLGVMIDSSWNGHSYDHNEDGAWVDTLSGWTPKPRINGYGDGLIYVNAKWAGLLEAPVNGTVCRYGASSAFADCGTVEAKNVDICVGEGLCDDVDDTTEASGICTNDGDSGGPYVMATGQMQGTNIAGRPKNTCDDPADEVFFQPATTTLSRYSKTMLTTHGSNAPTFVDLSCEGTGYSNFFCSTAYKSQGQVASSSIEWSRNSVVFDTGTSASGSCTGDQWNTVDVEATNKYGTGSDSTSFYCYSGSPP